MLGLVALSLLVLAFLVSAVMIPVSIAKANAIRNAAASATPPATPVIPVYFNWILWLITFLLTLFILCVLVVGMMSMAIVPQYGQGAQELPVVAKGSGTPIQYGLFPVQGGFGINVVVGEAFAGDNLVFNADGKTITPYKVDCRDFSDNQFYGQPTVTRCDFLFRNNGYDYVSVEAPGGYDVKEHGITLVTGATAISDNAWALP